MNPEPTWKVGELAARTGLTVRTLHHYDAIGLLSPTGRTGPAHGSGHRLYTAADLARLHQILCLKQLGFGLEQVKEFLTRPDYNPREVVRLHLESVRKRAAELAELGDRLRGLSEVLDREGEASPETFLQTIEAMTMIEKYYTPEQLKQLEERRAAGGEEMEETIRRAPQMWAALQSEVRAAMDAGVEPSDPNAQELAKRWFALVAAFTGGDPGIFKSLQTMYQNEDRVSGIDVAAMRPMMDYVQRAADAAGIKHPGQ
ncbi:family transcriptional regulator : Albicidin resistance domain-containing protein OS=Corallococcus coralloides (strain ATCC 25202 / DSM 2259 / NBRC 100086 / M2) GN=nolA PE=4 SV=1: MerR_1: TipAS [Gemmataceae bacterium]|nr:family transcriptional regulator : Albicidin resistance domain-containing protein OS=Corallococcus coralloides (strain ATCC 25202 / DSM 2259 / NBRC 100086 / M2) GN=nolA PE=4 SV=1: MerR_1: TipAS [Gemmataceae bacterium]VTT99238.1 family transcriptional regulator : Albicidin resistance domain-containing protein OS=Corallococcus coralloides (strain ATCC 25202 / DSM 2259 / NBRC 100086 / M2) GN=nolA PE=4 SV=1: MerR_1: TipAS [Gemmataceae bacterium]